MRLTAKKGFASVLLRNNVMHDLKLQEGVGNLRVTQNLAGFIWVALDEDFEVVHDLHGGFDLWPFALLLGSSI